MDATPLNKLQTNSRPITLELKCSRMRLSRPIVLPNAFSDISLKKDYLNTLFKNLSLPKVLIYLLKLISNHKLQLGNISFQWFSDEIRRGSLCQWLYHFSTSTTTTTARDDVQCRWWSQWRSFATLATTRSTQQPTTAKWSDPKRPLLFVAAETQQTFTRAWFGVLIFLKHLLNWNALSHTCR